jgi:AraC-like DNA-binding protein/ligand-binding sensor protein
VEIAMTPKSQVSYFDLRLAYECANIYSLCTGLGCAISDLKGEILNESGMGCRKCPVCEAVGIEKTSRLNPNDYSMPDGGEFGEKYIFFCRFGLTFISSPIISYGGSIANISAGPFFMTDIDDFIALELKEKKALKGEELKKVLDLLGEIPNIVPKKVSALSNLLSMTASQVSAVSAENQMRETRSPDKGFNQNQLSRYTLKSSREKSFPEYPVKIEKRLLECIETSDRPGARKLLNQLLGHILFSSGEDFDRIKSEAYELLVLISRRAIDAGLPEDKVLRMNRHFWRNARAAVTIEELCLLLTGIVNRYIDAIFDFSDKKNVEIIHKAIEYIRQNYSGKISLEDVAKAVYISPTYFCKLFRKEMGCNFNTYVNQLRIEKSKQILLQSDSRIADVLSMVGFEDQSYFTKVFKRVAGVSPKYFRRSAGVT